MRQRVVAVELHSPSNSYECTKCSKISETIPCCSHCKVILEPTSQPSFFALFGLQPCLTLDANQLQKKYYDLSKLSHPDKFGLEDSIERQWALRWSTWINKGYQTLRDSDSRIEYLLSLFGKYPGNFPKTPPKDLVEMYFELQELLVEGDLSPLNAFLVKLDQEEKRVETQWTDLQKRWSESIHKEAFIEEITNLLVLQKYLNSMKSDCLKKVTT